MYGSAPLSYAAMLFTGAGAAGGGGLGVEALSSLPGMVSMGGDGSSSADYKQSIMNNAMALYYNEGSGTGAGAGSGTGAGAGAGSGTGGLPPPPPPPPQGAAGTCAASSPGAGAGAGAGTASSSSADAAAAAAGEGDEEDGGEGNARRRRVWLKEEMDLLREAVAKYGRDWIAVSRHVGTRNNVQCQMKVTKEAQMGRIAEPGDKMKRGNWTPEETQKLKDAIEAHGRDWVAVSKFVGTKTREQCSMKSYIETVMGRMSEPSNKRTLATWTPSEVLKLNVAVARYGRDWVTAAHEVGTKTSMQCREKARSQVSAGLIPQPGPKKHKVSWTKSERTKLEIALAQHGTKWDEVAGFINTSKTPQMCADYVMREIALGHMDMPGLTHEPANIEWSLGELERLKSAVYEQVKEFGPKGIDWARVVEHVGAVKTEEQCRGKVTEEIRAGAMALPTANKKPTRGYRVKNRGKVAAEPPAAPPAAPDPAPPAAQDPVPPATPPAAPPATPPAEPPAAPASGDEADDDKSEPGPAKPAGGEDAPESDEPRKKKNKVKHGDGAPPTPGEPRKKKAK